MISGFLGSLSTVALAGTPNSAVFVARSIPAIGQPGLIALAFVVGIIGARIIQKMKTSNS